MPNIWDLTGKKVSETFKYLVQFIDGKYYNGQGEELNIPDSSTLSNYIQDSSLNHSTFIWENGYLDVSVIGGSGVTQSYVDGSLNNIRNTYIPDVSLGNDFFWNSGLLEVSVGSGTSDVTKAYVDGSVNNIRDTYIPNSSLGSDFFWNAGVLEVRDRKSVV